MLTLVTGGAGFIGSHLVEALLREGHSVRVLDNLSTGSPSNLRLRDVEFSDGDIRNPAALNPVMRGVDTVFHLAALPSVPRSIRDPLACHDVNVNGTFQVLLAAREAGVRRVVFASSSSVYGNTPELPKHESMMPRPLSPYAVAKLTGEHYCRQFHLHFGVETVVLRYFNVFGRRQNPNSEYAAVIPAFLATIRRGGQPTIYGDGEQTRDFTAVENVVSANLAAAASSRAPGNIYNIACGDRISLNHLLGEISDLTGLPVQARYLPARNGDVRDSLADIAGAQRDLGYAPRVTLREGLRRLVEERTSDQRTSDQRTSDQRTADQRTADERVPLHVPAWSGGRSPERTEARAAGVSAAGVA